jgi:uncharacterized protein YhaN
LRISTIQIDGFGVFRDTRVPELPPGLTVILRDNEAGKSTTLAFLWAILFGFPDGRSRDPQYPPLAGGNHGGSLVLETDSLGMVRVQRTNGPHGGPLQISQADGALLPPQTLDQLLAGVDVRVFRNVYAFSLHELSSFDALRDESLTGALYAASAGAGLSSLPQAERRLTQRQEGLFRPGGRNPEVNATLRVLDDVRQELRKAKGDLEAYQQESERLRDTEAEIGNLGAELKALSPGLARVGVYVRVWDQWLELRDCESALAGLPEPDRSIRPEIPSRLQQIAERLGALEENDREHQARIQGLSAQPSPQPLDDHLLEQEPLIVDLSGNLTTVRQDLHALPELQTTVRNQAERLHELLERLGDGWDLARVRAFDRSLFTRDRLRGLAQSLQESRAQSREAEAQAEAYEQNLAELSARAETAITALAEAETATAPFPPETVSGLEAEAPRIADRTRDLESLRGRTAQHEQTLREQLREILPDWDLERLSRFDCSLAVRKQATDRRAAQAHARTEETQARAVLEAAAENLRAAEASREDLNQQRDARGATLPNLSLDQVRARIGKLVALRQTLERYREAESGPETVPRNRTTARSRVPALIPLGLLLAVAVWLAVTGQAFAGVVLGLVTIALAAFAIPYFFPSRPGMDRETGLAHSLLTAIRDLALDLGLDPEPTDDCLAELDHALQASEQALLEWRQLQERMAACDRECEQAQDRHASARRVVEQRGQQLERLRTEWQEFVAGRGLQDQDLDPDLFLGMVDRVENLQRELVGLRRDQEHMAELEAMLRETREALTPLLPPDLQPLPLPQAVAQLLNRYRDLRNRLEHARERCRDAEREAENARKQLLRTREQQTLAAEREREALEQWGNTLESMGLSRGLAADTAMEALDCIDQVLAHSREQERTQALLAAVEERLTTTRDRLATCLQALQREVPAPAQYPSAIQSLRDELSAARERRTKAEERHEQVVHLQAQLERNRGLRSDLLREHDQLLADAGCGTEQEVRRECERQAQRQGLLDRSQQLAKELRAAVGDPDLDQLRQDMTDTDRTSLEQQQRDLLERRDQLEQEMEILRRQRADTVSRLQTLASDSTVADLRLREEALCEQIRDAARRWTLATTAQFLLREAKRRFERDQQPRVIQDATGFFQSMTNDRYREVFAPLGEETLELIDADGRRKTVDQLSRGTAEQLYLAIRFGFIRNHAASRDPLPVVMDDILVNFDPDRAASAARTIAELSNSHQILFFTCHPTTARLLGQHAPDSHLLHLRNGEFSAVSRTTPVHDTL